MENEKIPAIYKLLQAVKQEGVPPKAVLDLLDIAEQIPAEYKEIYLGAASDKFRDDASKGKK